MAHGGPLSAHDLKFHGESPHKKGQGGGLVFGPNPSQLPIGFARDSFDEPSYHAHVDQLQMQLASPTKTEMAAAGQARNATAKPSRMDEVVFAHRTGLPRGALAEIGPPQAMTQEELRMSATGEMGRGKVPWAANQFSEAAEVTFAIRGASPPPVPSHVRSGAAGLGGNVPEGMMGQAGCGQQFASGSTSAMGQTLRELQEPDPSSYQSVNSSAAAQFADPDMRAALYVNGRMDHQYHREMATGSTMQLGDHRMAFQPPEAYDAHDPLKADGMAKRRGPPDGSHAARTSASMFNMQDPAREDVWRPHCKPSGGAARTASNVALEDFSPQGPTSPTAFVCGHQRDLVPSPTKAHAGRAAQQTYEFRMDVPIPPGYIATKDGELKRAYRSPHANKGHRSDIGRDMTFDPDFHAANISEAHARKVGTLPKVEARVDHCSGLMHNDLGAPEEHYRPSGKAAVRGDYVPACSDANSSLVGKQMQWNDETAKVFNPDPHVGRGTGSQRAPDHNGMLSYSQGGGSLPPPPPRGVTEVEKMFYAGGNSPEVRRNEGGFGGGAEWMETAGLDHRGRGMATSNVDEAIFGKAPSGGLMHQQGVTANFNVGKTGSIGHR